jgi:phosphoribosyl 1,2-cyclic phosphodiesterase
VEIGASLRRVKGVCVSHEHDDHTAGLGVLHRRHGIPLYANSGTIDALRRDPRLEELPWRIFSTGAPFEVGGFRVEPFSVPHDAYDPVGFVVRAGGECRVGIVTDMGIPTTLVRERLRLCDVVVLEANHDEKLLQNARRPWALKQRILGRQGHLSNATAANLMAEIAGSGLQQVFLAHISADCNREDLALFTARQALERSGHGQVRVSATYADRVSDVWLR